MSKKKSLAEQWTFFETALGIKDTSSIQRQEMRRAFYAGATSLLDAMMTGLDEDREPTKDDLNYMDTIQAEIVQFGKDVKAGRA